MSLVAPTELETLKCSFCSKYLSVCPVTVFSDKKIKCGRASCTAPGEGTLSLYNLVADKIKFPCIFRYEGCPIQSNELELHEKEEHPESTGLKCCFCKADLESTYYFHAHVKTSHPDVILSKPVFWMDLTEYKIDEGFFYQENDILVLVGYTYTAAEPELLLQFVEIGLNSTFRKDLQRRHKFELYFPGNNHPVITEDIETSDDNYEFEVKLSKKPNHMVLCKFMMWSENPPDKTELQILDGANNKAVLLFTFNNVKQMKQQQTNFSPFTYTVAGRIWRFALRRLKSSEYGRDYLKVCLERSCHDTYDPCGVKVTFELQEVQVDQSTVVRHFVDEHFYGQAVWDFIPWESFVHSDTGYVDDEGNCQFNVTLHVLDTTT